MSRRSVSNHLDLYQIIDICFTNTQKTEHRTIIVIELTPPGWFLQFSQLHNITFVSADTQTDQSDRVTALLGTEHEILAHEISDPMDASLLAALAGTVTNSGVLLLAIPFCIDENLSLNNAEEESKLFEDNSQHQPTSNFCRRFSRLINSAKINSPNNVVICRYDANDKTAGKLPIVLATNKALPQKFAASKKVALAQNEQDLLLETACAHLRQSESACISIIGKRGRGKSALTARIANWLHDQHISYRITAAHHSALSTFHNVTDHASDAYFIPSQELKKCEIDTLLIDEASNLPLALLQELMTRHSRLILCTTVEGYESSGRAFELRMKEPIRQHFKTHLLLSPTVPWRWLPDDPIESLLDSLVLNDTHQSPQPMDHPASRDDVNFNQDNYSIRKVSQQTLLENEQELENVFTLLRDTHYQTTVKDLQHLLDGKDLFLWVLEDKNTLSIQAVLLLTLELGIDPSLHQAIVRKQRRLPHHLLTQLLAQTANSSDHLTSNFARIIRISVAQSIRRRGIGTMLLNYVENELMNDQSGIKTLDAVGASFANDTASVEFWRGNGYTTFHRGYRKNPRTGEQAIAVLRSEDALVSRSLDTAVKFTADNQAWQLAMAKPIGSKSADGLSQAQIELNSALREYEDTNDQQLLEQFSLGYRSFHDTFAAISRLSLKHPLSLEKNDGVSRKRFENTLREQVRSVLAGIF